MSKSSKRNSIQTTERERKMSVWFRELKAKWRMHGILQAEYQPKVPWCHHILPTSARESTWPRFNDCDLWLCRCPYRLPLCNEKYDRIENNTFLKRIQTINIYSLNDWFGNYFDHVQFFLAHLKNDNWRFNRFSKFAQWLLAATLSTCT